MVKSLLFAVLVSQAATPQESAFMRAWSVHAENPANHKAVIDACQAVMDRASTLGEFLPVVKTLAAWHLLAGNHVADAIRVFESARTTDKNAVSMARYSDTMARRWLTRLSHAQGERALRNYYADNVAYPAKLSQLLAMPELARGFPPTDGFGDPWVYESGGFSKLRTTANQRYKLYSKNLGQRSSDLNSRPFTSYGRLRANIVAVRRTTPVSVEFVTISADGEKRGMATESGVANGLRFLRLSSDGSFALLIDNECDFWVVAQPARGVR